MKIYMIRHGATQGNSEHRYVGSTDESLLPSAAAALRGGLFLGAGEIEEIYVSPMKRCRETAELLCPGRQQIVIEDFRECDFGEFEYRNYAELNGNPDYQRFIDTMGMCGFPGGEDRASFQARCAGAFEQVMSGKNEASGDIALVVHGGTLMAILDRYSEPHKDYYDWQAGNGQGYEAEAAWRENAGGLYLTKIRRL